jgi:hypothetical protein
MPDTETYLIDGRTAEGDAYLRAIDALPKDALEFVVVELPRKGSLKVCTYPEGFLVHRTLPDGSIWSVQPHVSKDGAKSLVGDFLAGREDWKAGLDWEQIALSAREGRHRMLRVLVVAGVVIGFALLVVRLITR